MKSFFTLLGIALIPLLHPSTGWVSAQDQPNIILLMADDLGWGDVGFNGNVVIQTPALDRLASEGMIHERFYAASPICSPTRGSCLTGRHPYRFGVLAAHTAGMRKGEITIAEIARERNYQTGIFGKWHIGYVHPTQVEQRGSYSPPGWHGFENSFVTRGAVPTWDPTVTPMGWNRWDEKAGTPWKNGEIYYENGVLVTENLEGDDSRVIMDRVLPFIRQSVEAKRPFLACVWFHTPHEPVVAGPEYLAMYADAPTRTQHYYGSITAMDEQIGRLDAELKQLGIKENTILFFCSDNGPSKDGSAGPFRGSKHSPYEGGIRVPSFSVWPAVISPGQRSDFVAGTVDYFPTIAEILNYEFPKQLKRPIDGVSLLPAFNGDVTVRSKPILSGYRRLYKGQDVKAYIEKDFKLLQNRAGKWELYNLSEDPRERDELSSKNPEVLTRMMESLEALEDSIQASLNGADYEY